MTPEFEELISWGGSPQATCGCGRVHFTARGTFMEPGELDGLLAKQKADPDHYIGDEANDGVSIGTLGGVTAVWGCKCGLFDRVEDYLWDNRDRFLRYYRARIEREKKQAEASAELLPK